MCGERKVQAYAHAVLTCSRPGSQTLVKGEVRKREDKKMAVTRGGGGFKRMTWQLACHAPTN